MNNDNIYNILKNFNKVAVQETAKPVEAKPKTQLAENMEQVLGKKLIAEKAANKYAVGMSQAMKSTGDKPPLKKSTIVKAHEIAKKVKEDRYKTIDDYLDAKRAREQEHGGEEEKKSNKRTVVGHYGKHYDPTDDDEDVVQKAKDTSGEKRGRGRPKGSVKAQTKADTADIKADKKKQVKGNVTKVKSGKKVKEGQYKTIEAMIKEAFGDEDEDGQLSYEQDQLRQALGDEAFAQVQEFVDQGADPMALPDELYNALYDYYEDDMPYAVKSASSRRDAPDPFEWISEKLMSVFGDETSSFDPPFDPDEKSQFKKKVEPGHEADRAAALRNRGIASVKDVDEATGDKPFDNMMGKIVKGAGGLKKKSSDDEFEQVYDLVEVSILQDYFHSDLDDDISDALVKLKIKPTDELIAGLETAFIDRSSAVLKFYDADDMEESQQGMAEAINETEYPGQLDTSKLILKSIRHTGGDSHPGSPGYFDGPVYDNSGQYIGDLGFFPGSKLSSGNHSWSSTAVLSVKNPRDPHLQDYWEKMGKNKIGYGNFPLDYKITDLNDPLMKQAISQVEKLKQGVAEGKMADKDYDKDGKIETGSKEHAGAVDKAIKDKAVKDKEDDELAEMMRLSGVNVDEDKLAKKDYDKDGEIETGSEEHAGAVDKAIKKNQVTDDEKVDECMGSGMMSPVPGQAMEQEGKMNINTNMSSDGTKSVSISADGEAAVQLMQMLKLAGMGGQGPATPQAEPGVTVVSTEPEAEVDEEKDPRYQANTSPEEHVMPVQALTKGGDGDVAGKEKAMTPNGYQFGDNPRAMREAIHGLDNFGHNMMKEYESIKIKK